MPGLELFGSSEPTTQPTTVVEVPAAEPASTPAETNGTASKAGAYYNARLDPKNYLEGPLSINPATRLRQMLARPGIVVSTAHFDSHIQFRADRTLRLPRVSVTVSARAVLSRLASPASTRGTSLNFAIAMSND